MLKLNLSNNLEILALVDIKEETWPIVSLGKISMSRWSIVELKFKLFCANLPLKKRLFKELLFGRFLVGLISAFFDIKVFGTPTVFGTISACFLSTVASLPILFCTKRPLNILFWLAP